MNLFYQTHQEHRVTTAAGEADRALSKAGRLTLEVNELTRRVDRLSLACQALWELTQPRLGITEDRLREKMLEIDQRDGSADGRIQRTVVACPACGQGSNSRRSHCLYCGAQMVAPHTFG